MVEPLTRREAIAAAGAATLAFAGGGFAQRHAIAHGSVFDAAAGDGRPRSGAGLAGVMVSNGRDVVLTAGDGSYQLPVEAGDSVFVIEPSGWAAPMGPGGVPRFSRLYQPDGSPAYLGGQGPLVEPTGPATAAWDFPLTRRQEPPRFSAFLVSDPQPDSETELDYVRDDIVAAMLGRSAAFGINHGDVVADTLSLYPRYLEILGATGIPWHHCPGNHDINHAARDDSLSRETWKRTFGARHYAFQYAQATFILLDNVEYLGQASGRYRGRIGPRQLAFVRNVLRHVPSEHLVVLSMHIPLRCYLDPANPADNTADRHLLMQLLAGHPNTVSFAGHLHATEHHYLGASDGFSGMRPHHHHVLTAASGSWWSGPIDRRGIPAADSCDGTPNGFHMLHVDGNRYTTEFVPAIAKPGGQLRLAIDAPHRPLAGGTDRRTAGPAGGRCGFKVPRRALGESALIANLFDGGPSTRVTCEIAGHAAPLPMQQARIADPVIVAMLAGDCPRKPWVAPVASSHIWRMRLPASLPAGVHRLTVRAHDEYGRQHTQHAVLEVSDSGTSAV